MALFQLVLCLDFVIFLDMKQVIAQFFAIAIICMGVLISSTAQAQSQAEPYQWYPVTPPVKAPDILFRLGENKPAKLADFKGKLIVLNFWARWCGPCVNELPTLEWLARQHADEVTVIVMNIEKQPFEKVAGFIHDELKLSHVVTAQDQLGTLYDALSQGALPTTYVIDENGMLIYAYLGATDWINKEHLPYILGKK